MMSQGIVRERSLNDDGEIRNLFQGAHPDTRGEIYRGDRYARSDTGLTLQIHRLRVLAGIGSDAIAEDVPAIAVWVPRDMSADWLSQDQGGSR
jgi:hypothetical protein